MANQPHVVNFRTFKALSILVVLFSSAFAQDSFVRRVSVLEESGKFAEAAKVITAELSKTQTPDARRVLEFELDRLRRIPLDFPFTREKVWGQVQKAVRGVTKEEFERWIAEGRFDIRYIDGEERFVYVSRSNLFWRYPEIRARRLNPPNQSPFEMAVWKNAKEIMAESRRSGKPYVLPKRFRVTMSVMPGVDADADGLEIRAWLPIPRAFPFQAGFKVLETSSPVTLDDPDSPIRSAYFVQKAVEDTPTIFKIVYEYTHQGIFFDVDPAKVRPVDPGNAALRKFTAEGPHVFFSDSMKALAHRIAGSISNPMLKARAYYNWIAENIQYSYAIEYSTIRDIGEYCRSRGYGDCGQESLLYITLCRMSGIPARWQSGWFTFPGGKTMHDWTEIYIEPYGWIPVDPYMGIFAMQYLETLSPSARIEVRDFYFGGLDQYRIAANSDHSQELRPAKKGLRSETVDFQRGELEANGKNIYFDEFSYTLDAEELPPSQ